MPPVYEKPTFEKYDYVVIGGGSGGSGTSVGLDAPSHLGIELMSGSAASCFIREESCSG